MTDRYKSLFLFNAVVNSFWSNNIHPAKDRMLGWCWTRTTSFRHLCKFYNAEWLKWGQCSLPNYIAIFPKQLMRQFLCKGDQAVEKQNVMATEISYCFTDLWQYSWKSEEKNKQTEAFCSLENLKRKIMSFAILIFILMISLLNILILSIFM